LRDALKSAAMVSRDSILGIGIALLFGLILSSKNGNILQGGAPSPVDPSIDLDPVGTEISFIQTQINQAMSFLKSNFKDPILTKGLTTGGKTFPCRGPNCLGIFQAKGTVTSFDPFTGQRLAIAGSTPFQNITGFDFGANQTRIDQGNSIKSTIQAFIDDSSSQIDILEANSAV